MGHAPIGTKFDDTTYLTGGVTTASDNKFFTASMWLRMDADNAQTITVALLRSGSQVAQIVRRNNNSFQFLGYNSGGVVLNVNSSVNSINISTGWTHCVFSCDLSNASNRHLYVDDSSDLAAVTTYTDSTIDWGTNLTFWMGANQIGSAQLDGAVADLWWTNEYIDLSVEANRRKFITADGRPVNLGDGTGPTGTAPLWYFAGFPNHLTNIGSGPDLTVAGGAPLSTEGPIKRRAADRS
jgi:hypothetical protein